MTTTTIGDRDMTTLQNRRSTRATKPKRATKPRRDAATETSLPTHDNGLVDMAAVLEFALTAPGQLSQCYSRFHRYSMLNSMLVLMQTGRMEPIATFNRWKELDRKVIKGSKALFINHPKFAPDLDRETGLPRKGADGKPIMKVVGFQLRPTVFQLSQTDGPELAMPDVPEWNKSQAMASLNITEERFSHNDGNTQGYSYERVFAINPMAEYPLKTMFHEWAHILLGHTDRETESPHRGVAEFQAEAVALLVCSELGVTEFDAAQCRGYIQHWLHGTTADYLTEDGELAVTDRVVRQVFSVTDQILTAGRDKLESAKGGAE